MDKTRSEEAAARKRCGKYNCAQAVAGLYADMVGMDEETINAATSAFGSGTESRVEGERPCEKPGSDEGNND